MQRVENNWQPVCVLLTAAQPGQLAHCSAGRHAQRSGRGHHHDAF